MKRYTGVSCVSCNEKFTDQDDVVVCPECGAPHHRECYAKLGQCALADKHSLGQVWQPPSADGESHGEQIICPNCKAGNPKASQYCQMCGTKLHTTFQERREPPPASEGGFTPPPGTVYTGNVDNTDQWEIHGVSAREISTYIGNNSHYYLRQFRAMQMNTTQWSWNWSAFFFGPLFFLYRKLYLPALITFAAHIICNLPALIYSFEATKMAAPELGGIALAYSIELMERMSALSRIGQAISYVLMGFQALYSNRFFMKKVIGDIKDIHRRMPGGAGSREYYTRLFFAGRPNRTFVIVACFLLANLVVLYFQYLLNITQIPLQ